MVDPSAHHRKCGKAHQEIALVLCIAGSQKPLEECRVGYRITTHIEPISQLEIGDIGFADTPWDLRQGAHSLNAIPSNCSRPKLNPECCTATGVQVGVPVQW